ncbi:MAG: helicase, partial [Dehalococcoidia bacterium]|nr:helicase [Dehalococcoidia bacterium]
CGPELEGRPLPKGYNSTIMRVKRKFAEEVTHRQAEREYTPSLTQGQRYVVRELRVLFNASDDDDLRAQLNILDAAFRRPLTRALNRELNRVRRNGITGEALFKTLGELYYQHNMRDWAERRGISIEDQPIPVIICSEGLK